MQEVSYYIAVWKFMSASGQMDSHCLSMLFLFNNLFKDLWAMMWTTRLPVIVWHKYMQIQTFCLILYIVLTILLVVILRLILEIRTTYRLASYLLGDNWLICRLHTQCMISKCNVKLVRCDDVFVVIYTMYNKTVIRFGFCDFRDNQGLGTCKFYQPWPLAWLIT